MARKSLSTEASKVLNVDIVSIGDRDSRHRKFLEQAKSSLKIMQEISDILDGKYVPYNINSAGTNFALHPNNPNALGFTFLMDSPFISTSTLPPSEESILKAVNPFLHFFTERDLQPDITLGHKPELMDYAIKTLPHPPQSIRHNIYAHFGFTPELLADPQTHKKLAEIRDAIYCQQHMPNITGIYSRKDVPGVYIDYDFPKNARGLTKARKAFDLTLMSHPDAPGHTNTAIITTGHAYIPWLKDPMDAAALLWDTGTLTTEKVAALLGTELLGQTTDEQQRALNARHTTLIAA